MKDLILWRANLEEVKKNYDEQPGKWDVTNMTNRHDRLMMINMMRLIQFNINVMIWSNIMIIMILLAVLF